MIGRPSISDALQLIELIALRPSMYVQPPQEAAGIVETLAAFTWASATELPLDLALRHVGRELTPLAVLGGPSDFRGCVLSQESREDPTHSFEAFSRNARALLKLLDQSLPPERGPISNAANEE